MIADILSALIIFPLQSIIELAYLLVWKIFKNPSMAILGVSVAVSTLTLPLYFMAEKLQDAERDIQQRMKPAADTIKAVFHGDERYMMITTLHRQNHYHPVYALRSSVSLIIQIPFFIAAYRFISSLEELNEASFLFIKNLSLPDGIISVNTISFNMLPVIMTVINCVSAAVYAKGLPLKDKIQLYGMAGIFLVLLYNSPAGLVLYWTSNNVYGLLKNIIQKNEKAKRFFFILLGAAALGLAFFVLFKHPGALKKRIVIAIAAVFPFFILYFRKKFRGKPVFFLYFLQKMKSAINPERCSLGYKRTFLFSAIALCILAGLVIPSGLIASSVGEFSHLEPFDSPLPFIGITLLQSGGIFLWLLCLYFLFDKPIKIMLSFFITLALSLSVLNVFVFNGNYGFLLPDLQFSDFKRDGVDVIVINILMILAVSAVMILLLTSKYKILLFSLQNIALASFLILGLMNVIKIVNTYNSSGSVEVSLPTTEKIYTFSRKGQNVLVIMLDRGISGYVPYIFKEKPSLLESFKGFRYYPNCVSFGAHTVFGAPGIFGGYEYTPLEINKRKAEKVIDKYHEALLVLPRILADSGFEVTVSNMPNMDDDLYEGINGISVRNTSRHFYIFSNEHRNLNLIDYYTILSNNLIRFSFFKFMPLFLRNLVYDHGGYLTANTSGGPKIYYPRGTIASYATLSYLRKITEFSEEEGRFAAIIDNELTHEPAFFEAPDYIPVTEITDKGSGLFAEEDHYHVNIAAFLLLGKWFDFLKENGVYGNTRIIIVSDHGGDIQSPFPENMTLPDGRRLEAYNCLLLVKDFHDDFSLKTDGSFMTNADVPLLTSDGLTADPKNPLTGKPLVPNKENGVTIATSRQWSPEAHFLRYSYDIRTDEWMFVKDNIFEPGNWSKIVIKD